MKKIFVALLLLCGLSYGQVKVFALDSLVLGLDTTVTFDATVYYKNWMITLDASNNAPVATDSFTVFSYDYKLLDWVKIAILPTVVGVSDTLAVNGTAEAYQRYYPAEQGIKEAIVKAPSSASVPVRYYSRDLPIRQIKIYKHGTTGTYVSGRSYKVSCIAWN